MSSRIFQSVVLQMKESTDRAVGVIDEQGTVVACNELASIGEKWPAAALAVNADQENAVVCEGYTFKALAGWNGQFDYAAFAKGEDEQARLVCSLATVALNGAKTYYEEKHDRSTFVKNIISDNILLGDIYVRAKELHFVSEVPRAVLLIRQVGTPDISAIDVVQGLYPDKQVDFVISVSESDIALVKQLPEGAESKDLYKIALNVQETLARELGDLYVDTGAIYRTVALRAWEAGADPSDPEQIAPLLKGLDISMDYGPDGEQQMFLEGEDVSKAIREHQISGLASKVSAIPAVRDFLLEFQRTQAREHNVVMDGRDIGTVVLPQADVKIFLTAAPESRARRRLLELEGRGQKTDFETVLRDIVQRDEQDRNRPIAPLRQAEDAVLLDTTRLNLEESLAAMLSLIKEKIHL